MHRVVRFLAVAVPIAAATAPVALAGADPASEARGTTATVAARSAAVVASTAVERARTPAPATIVAIRPGGALALRSRPGGRVVARIGDTTQFGSQRRLGVVRRQGRWLGVTTPELPNGTLGWIDGRADSVALSRTRWSIHASVSKRRIVLRRGARVVRRLAVAVGRSGSPTPTGRFAVTDKMPGTRYGPYYGCCILALSATQPSTPSGWTGGDRMAIHGTSDPGSIGTPASAGCLRAADADLRALTDSVPVGTPVIIGR